MRQRSSHYMFDWIVISEEHRTDNVYRSMGASLLLCCMRQGTIETGCRREKWQVRETGSYHIHVGYSSRSRRHGPDARLVWRTVRQRTMVDFLVLFVAAKNCRVRRHSYQSGFHIFLSLSTVDCLWTVITVGYAIIMYTVPYSMCCFCFVLNSDVN